MTPLVETLNHLGRWLLPHLRQMSIELAVLAGVVLAVIYVLRVKSPALRHAFWCLVLAKPVVTFLVASPVSLYWFMRPPVQAPAPVRAASAPLYPTTDTPIQMTRRPKWSHSQRATPPVAPQAAPPAWEQLDRHGVVSLAWMALAIALGLRLVIGYAYVMFLRQTATLQRGDPLAEIVRDVARGLGMRRAAAIATTEVAHGPILAGVWRPVILLPRRLSEVLSGGQLRHVIAHELIHVRRRDNLVLLVQRIAEMCFFFHPVVWLCGWMMRREAEAACDDAVIKAFGGSAAYADSLTRVAEMKCGITRRLLVNTFAAAESNFSQRVRRILDGRVGRMTLGVTVVSVIMLVVIGCVGLPMASARRTDHSPEKGSDMARKVTTAKGSVKRDGSKVWIEGVPALPWGQGKECTFAGALEAALAVTAHPYSYADVMGLTGLAFRVRWSNEDTKTKWCGSCAIGEMPDELTDVGRLTGWALPTDTQSGEDQPDTDTIRRKIVASIDAGRPVMAYASCLEMAVVYGYADGGGTLLVSDYRIDQPFRLPVEKIGPLQTYLGERAEPPSRRDALIEALKTAVVNWRRERHDGGIAGREYLYGDAALKAWMQDLDAADALPEDKKDAFFRLNGWNYRSWKDARAVAVTFMEGRASLLNEEARDALMRAARLYQEELDYLANWEKTHRSWSVESVDAWTDAVRNGQRESLSIARRNEIKAIAEIEKALAAEGVDVASAVASVVSGSVSVTTKPSAPTKTLKGYRWQPRWISHVGCWKPALDQLGIDVSMPWLYGTSGYAFLLNIHRDLCPSGWHVVGVPLAGFERNVGFECQVLARNHESKRTKGELRRQAWDGVRKTIDAGLPCYGYDLEIGDYYVVYGYDDVGYYYSGPLCEKGKGPLPWKDYGVTNQVGIIDMVAVTPGGKRDDKTAVRSALVWAVRHARGAAKEGDLYVGGLAAYDQWVRALEGEDLGAHPAAYNAACYHECRQAAVEFLREAKQRVGGEHAPLFDVAIKHYAALAASLAAVKDLFPWPPKEEHVKDAARRREAIKRLKEAKVVEERGVHALGELAMALGADEGDLTVAGTRETPSTDLPAPTAKVRREGERAVIADVPRPQGTNTMLASLTSVLQSIGEDVSYEYLMGVSSRAFRLQFAWCPSGPHACVGFNTFKPAVKAVGYDVSGYLIVEFDSGKAKAPDQDRLQAARQAVKAAIDTGVPVMFGSEEEGVLVGYEPPGEGNATGWLCRPGPLGGPPKKDEPYTKAVAKVPWGVSVLARSKGEPPSRREGVIWSLKTAVANAHRGDVNGLAIGFAAWEKWIAELRDFEVPRRETKAQLAKQDRPHSEKDVASSLCLGNAWCFESLIDARRAAGTYLRSVAAQFGTDAAGHLREAATHYDAVVKCLTTRRSTEIAPYPWMLKDKKKWTDAIRTQQAAMLADALALERKAVAEIAKALEAEGIDALPSRKGPA